MSTQPQPPEAGEAATTSQRTPFAINRDQPGTINDSGGAIVCVCLDSGPASKSQRAAFIVRAVNSHAADQAKIKALTEALNRIAHGITPTSNSVLEAKQCVKEYKAIARAALQPANS